MIVTERERGRDTGRGRSRLHAPGARCGTRSRVSRIAPWAKGRRQAAAPPRDPYKFFFKYFIYLFMRDTERMAETQAREKQAPCRDPDVGFDPGSPGSRPGPKAGAKPLRHPGIPQFDSFLFEAIRFFLIRFDSIRFFSI